MEQSIEINIHIRIIELGEEIDLFLKKWQVQLANPAFQDQNQYPPDHYMMPIWDYADFFAEKANTLINNKQFIHGSVFSNVRDILISNALRMAEAYRSNNKSSHHCGAFYVHMAISCLTRKAYKDVIYWMDKAESEDMKHHSNYSEDGSFAFEKNGFFGQWLGDYIYKRLYNEVKTNYSFFTFFDCCRWLLRCGDISLISAVGEYLDYQEKDVDSAMLIKWSCLRELATLFEVMVRFLGDIHNDPIVKEFFCDCDNSLANLLQRPNFFNSKDFHRQLVYCFDNYNNKLFVNTALNLLWADTAINELVKYFYSAYRLRNLFSHRSNPKDNDFRNNYDKWHNWLLQAILGLYSWAIKSSQFNFPNTKIVVS